MTEQDHAEPPRTLADKLNYLVEVLHNRNQAPASNEDVAAGIAARGGPTISASYLWLLRTGRRTNPTAQHLQALADYFGVTPEYFFDSAVAEEINRELKLIRAMRDAGVRQLALRASDLNPDALTAITIMVEQARKVQGLPDSTNEVDRGPGERQASRHKKGQR